MSKSIVALLAITTGCVARLSGSGTMGPPPPPPPSGSGLVAHGGSEPVAYEESPGEPEPGAPVRGPRERSAWTLEEREYWKKLQEEMDDFARKANDHCHSRIHAGYLQESFRGKLTAGGNYGLPSYTRSVCTAALSAILDVCTGSDSAKRAVASHVERVVCEYGPTQYSLADGTFHVTIDAANENHSYYLRGMIEHLKRHL